MGAKGKLVLLPTLGGQTALNTAMALFRSGTLEKYGVEMIGANARAIRKARRRPADFQGPHDQDRPGCADQRSTAHNVEEARAVAEKIEAVTADHPASAHPGRDGHGGHCV